MCVPVDGLSGISKMTRAKVGQKICVSSPNLTQWKISGRKCFFLVLYWSHIISPFFSYNKAWKSEWQIMMDLTWHHLISLLRLYNHIQQPSKLGFGCDYSLFKVSWGSVWSICPNWNVWLVDYELPNILLQSRCISEFLWASVWPSLLISLSACW